MPEQCNTTIHLKPRPGRPPHDDMGKKMVWDPFSGRYVKNTIHNNGNQCPTKRRRFEDDNDYVSDTSSRTSDVHDDDDYDSLAKISHRHEFAINCQRMSLTSTNKKILYLETSAGMTTKALLQVGFDTSNLHPCNHNSKELVELAKKYPGVVVHEGDIMHEYKKERTWLGIWFDLQTSLLKVNEPNQPWDRSLVPRFSRAIVCAMTLSSRRVRDMTTEEFAVELQALMQEEEGFLTSPQMARAYSGRSNKQNMVFALAHYEPYTWEAKDYLHQHVHVPFNYYKAFGGMEDYMQVNGHLVATVTRVASNGKAVHLKFMSKSRYFFTNEDIDPPVPIDVLDAWIIV